MKPARINKTTIFTAALQAQEKHLAELSALARNTVVSEGIERTKAAIAKLKKFSSAWYTESDAEGAVVIYHDEKDDLVHYVFILNESERRFFLVKPEKAVFWFASSDFLGSRQIGETVLYEWAKPGDGELPIKRVILDIY